MSIMYAKHSPVPVRHVSVHVGVLKTVSGNYDTNASSLCRRFTDEVQIEVGSTAVVTKAYDHRLQRHVALKRMKIDRVMHREIREFTMGKAIGEHPNVATMYEKIYTAPNEVCLVMECADGGNLVDMLAGRTSGLELKDFVVVARQLVAGVSHMHKLGIAHRDIKSDNISLSADGCNMKLLDYGESQKVTDPVDVLACGTRSYISPEIIAEIEKTQSQFNLRRKDFDLLAADVWSLGITLYSICTAQIPFTYASTQDSGYRNYLLDEIMGSRRVWSTIEVEIQTLLVHMCDPNPLTRWTMLDVVDFLDAQQ